MNMHRKINFLGYWQEATSTFICVFWLYNVINVFHSSPPPTLCLSREVSTLLLMFLDFIEIATQYVLFISLNWLFRKQCIAQYLFRKKKWISTSFVYFVNDNRILTVAVFVLSFFLCVWCVVWVSERDIFIYISIIRQKGAFLSPSPTKYKEFRDIPDSYVKYLKQVFFVECKPFEAFCIKLFYILRMLLFKYLHGHARTQESVLHNPCYTYKLLYCFCNTK